MTYNVFESTNMGSTRYAERILDCVADVDVENGTLVELISARTSLLLKLALPSVFVL